MNPPQDTNHLLETILDKLDDMPDRMTRVEILMQAISKKLDAVCDMATDSRERVVKLEMVMPEKHLMVHERLENKLTESQGKVQSILNMGSVAVNALIAWFVSQGLR